MTKTRTAQFEYPFTIKAGIAAVTLVSLWGALEYAASEAEYQRQNADPYKVSQQVSRFDGFRAAVPEETVLGYITDLPVGASADAAFNAAQYALAPRILKKGAGYGKVLGNFSSPADFAAIGREKGLALERDFGSGVVVFRRESR